MFSLTTRRILVFAALVAVVWYIVRHQRQHPSSSYPGPRSSQAHRGAPSSRVPRHRRAPRGAPETGETPGGVVCETQYFADWQEPSAHSCSIMTRHGYPVPDPRCTPGGVNPSVSLDVLDDSSWRTRIVRNCASSEAQKHITYRWYAIEKPRVNSNQNQVCELDHLVPLELGGADGLGNIWPQCGPDSAALNERYFKKKDHVENYLAEQVKAGVMPLEAAQKGIASDWTQFLSQAESWCSSRHRC